MTQPPPYPRTPYLWDASSRTQDDRLVPTREVSEWLHTPVLAEEKLDGANVSLWFERGQLRVATRGGADAMDRAGQLGRLRAWGAERHAALAELLAGDLAAYGEWLWLTHGTRYDQLPDWLVVLDLWDADAGFVPVQERDRRACASGLVTPPVRFEGVFGSKQRVESCLGPSAYSSTGRAEGLVLRAADGRRCKVVDPSYLRRSDEEWRTPEHNRLVATPASP